MKRKICIYDRLDDFYNRGSLRRLDIEIDALALECMLGKECAHAYIKMLESFAENLFQNIKELQNCPVPRLNQTY